MTTHDKTIANINNLPESLVEEVNDFIDYLIWKHSEKSQQMAESNFTNYLSNLEDYESSLARGEIQW